SRIPEPVAPAPPSGASSAPPVGATTNAVETTAAAVLRWMLRHRSQLHVVDLQREIAALRDDEGSVRADPAVIASSRRNLIDATFQVAIELTIGQRDVEQVLTDRPEFRRQVHDAMYYISRLWLDGADIVDLSPSGRPAF